MKIMNKSHQKLRSTEEIGACMRQERKAQGISQEQLAGVAGTLFSDKGKLSFAYETAYLQQN